MSPNTRQITFINAAHTLTHYSLLVLPTAVLAMAAPAGAFGEAYGPILALATGMFVLYGAFSLPQGWIAHRVGRPLERASLRGKDSHAGDGIQDVCQRLRASALPDCPQRPTVGVPHPRLESLATALLPHLCSTTLLKNDLEAGVWMLRSTTTTLRSS